MNWYSLIFGSLHIDVPSFFSFAIWSPPLPLPPPPPPLSLPPLYSFFRMFRTSLFSGEFRVPFTFPRSIGRNDPRWRRNSSNILKFLNFPQIYGGPFEFSKNLHCGEERGKGAEGGRSEWWISMYALRALNISKQVCYFLRIEASTKMISDLFWWKMDYSNINF